jgi:UDP-glucose 4-epimerase
VAIDDLSVGKAENLASGVDLVVCDILDTERTARALQGAALVYHMAARVAIRSSFEFVVADTMVNVSGTASVLRAAQLAGTVRKVVFTSSMAVYADSPEGTLIDEFWPTEPISPYGISKLAAESLVRQLCAHAGIESAVLRLFNTYGPGQALSPYVGAVTIFCNQFAAGRPLKVFGDGEQCRDFVHVQDVVQALLLAGSDQAAVGTFNIGTGTATTVNDVIAHLQQALDLQTNVEHADAVPGELRSSVPDITRARTVLGYSPRYRFSAAIAEVAREIVPEGRMARTAR